MADKTQVKEWCFLGRELYCPQATPPTKGGLIMLKAVDKMGYAKREKSTEFLMWGMILKNRMKGTSCPTEMKMSLIHIKKNNGTKPLP